MSSTRENVLRTLLTRQHCTIKDLAKAVGINPISVRHHVTRLEMDGLVTSKEERHGVGRPRRVYSLTEKGMEQFPTRYLSLTIRLLEQLKETLPKSMVNELFAQVANNLSESYTSDLSLDDISIEERLDMVQNLLQSEGFTMEWQRQDDGYYIREVNCPYYHIGQTHPEVCVVDQNLISNVLNTPIEKIKCILDGDSYCTYLVPVVEDAK